MQKRSFNFVKRKSAIKFDFLTRESRVTASHAMPRGFVAAARSVLLSVVVFVVFIFSANLIIRYAFETMNVKGFTLDISPFAKPKYFILKGNMYVVYSNGKTEFVDKNMDKASLPYITGIEIAEKRKAHKKAFGMAIGIDKKYLGNIAEINLNNPENIVMITMDSKKIYAGDTLTNEKMENYNIALDRITRSYSTVDLRYRDRVIIK